MRGSSSPRLWRMSGGARLTFYGNPKVFLQDKKRRMPKLKRHLRGLKNMRGVV